MLRRTPVLFVVLLPLLLAMGCGEEERVVDTTAAPGPAESTELPEGHPPIGDGSQAGGMGGGLPAPPPGTGRGAQAVSWSKPERWEDVEPSSRMRRAEYRIPGPEGDGSCAVFYFGPGQGGDPAANARRWAGQFRGPGGAAAEPETTTLEIDGLDVLRVEVTGTYAASPGMGGPSAPLDDAMLLGAIVEGPDANWFFKCTGPQPTMAAAEDEFDALLRSLDTGASA
jgi:hypothetical protein